jgi:hypothetical protein
MQSVTNSLIWARNFPRCVGLAIAHVSRIFRKIFAVFNLSIQNLPADIILELSISKLRRLFDNIWLGAFKIKWVFIDIPYFKQILNVLRLVLPLEFAVRRAQALTLLKFFILNFIWVITRQIWAKRRSWVFHLVVRFISTFLCHLYHVCLKQFLL